MNQNNTTPTRIQLSRDAMQLMIELHHRNLIDPMIDFDPNDFAELIEPTAIAYDNPELAYDELCALMRKLHAMNDD